MFVQDSLLETQTLIHEPDRVQCDHTTACVIAWKFSSTTLVSLHIHSHKEKFGVRFIFVTF
jgi:hypothetical protein